MKRPENIILRMLLLLLPLLTAMAPAMAQDTVYTGQTTTIGVIPVAGDTYVWELYNDPTGINFATDPGNCPPADAYFTGSANGPSVDVMWLTAGTYFFKVTAYRGNCTMNLKVGKMVVLWEIPTAVILPPSPICIGDSVHLTIQLTGNGPWNVTVTDGTNSWVINNITTNTYNFTVPVVPTVSTLYWISSVTDIHGTNTVPSPQVLQVVNPKPVNSIIYQYGP